MFGLIIRGLFLLVNQLLRVLKKFIFIYRHFEIASIKALRMLSHMLQQSDVFQFWPMPMHWRNYRT